MDQMIKKMLKENRVDTDGVFHTHVSLIRPRGKFQFNRQSLEEFWSAYCEDGENGVFGIAEKPQQYLPVLSDIDLRIKDDGMDLHSDSLYTPEQLKTVVEIYQSVLRQIVDKCTSETLTCVVLEKKMYTQTKNDISYLKHGFHLHFPYCFLNKIDQEVHLIPRVKDAMKEANIFRSIGIEDSGETVDKVCCKVPWLLYGSRKSEDAEPYKVTKVYDGDMKEVDLEKGFKNYQLYDHREQLINIKGKVKQYLPRILSIVPYGRETRELKRGLISPLKEKMKKEKKASSTAHATTGYHNMSVQDALNMARKLLPMLADFRADDRNEWMNIGWVLYNISEGSPEGLDLWCDFSSRCEDKYDEGACIYQWERMTKKDKTIGTLRHYAKVDNPEEYKKLNEENSTKHIMNSLDGSHNDVAKALYEEYGDEFVCASITNRVWFQFVRHKWEQIEEGTELRKKISGSIVKRYTDSVKKLYDEMAECKDKTQETMISARIKQIQKMIINLKNSGYKNNVMREATEVFYDPRFKEKLDTDPYLIAFENGVYDLKANNFRPGIPEDFLSKCMPIRYTEFSEDDERVQEVHTFIEQVFPDKSLRKYFMDIASDIFVGGNHQKTVVFWTGDGDNGKSVTQSLFEKMLGPLAIKLNTNVITGKKPSAGSAFADLARAGGGVRWCVLEEPDNDETINPGILKNLTGNDSYYARDLFERGKDGREIKPLFKLIFITNKLPHIKGADKAVWNRVRVLPFESTFCRPENPAPESYEEQLRQKRFPMDKEFGKKIPRLLEPFAWILLKHRQKVTNRMEPEKVRAATEIYKKQNDIYRQFIEEYIAEDAKSVISLTEVYNLFKEWFKESLPGHTVPVKNEVEEYLVKVWGNCSNKRWKGYRQRTFKDDIETGNAHSTDDGFIVYEDEDDEKSNLPPM